MQYVSPDDVHNGDCVRSPSLLRRLGELITIRSSLIEEFQAANPWPALKRPTRLAPWRPDLTAPEKANAAFPTVLVAMMGYFFRRRSRLDASNRATAEELLGDPWFKGVATVG
jgi:hypothetical protein